MVILFLISFLKAFEDSYRPEISPDEFIQIHIESMENGTGLVFPKTVKNSYLATF